MLPRSSSTTSRRGSPRRWQACNPRPPRRRGVYFVGFAGDGDQAVFRREALFAAQAFGARFDSTPRSVLLINDVEDRDSYPLASVSGLAQTLKLLASRMNADEDVLVLFLTSHGSEEGLEVENGSLPLAQLTPADLHQALDASGIRWRIVVVSACYAGVFLDELKSDNTAIMTASDAEHSSFGCDADRDLTWFGEAFLKDALPGSDSLEDAFHKAAALIARREDAEHQMHSNPQLYHRPAHARKACGTEASQARAARAPHTPSGDNVCARHQPRSLATAAASPRVASRRAPQPRPRRRRRRCRS